MKICGSALFGLSIWMRLESGFQEWVEYLDMYEFYIGVYILIFISLIVMGIAFVGCAAALMDHVLALYVVQYHFVSQNSLEKFVDNK